MKFSMIFEAQIADTSRASEHQVFQECVEQSLRAEQLGFDGIWAVEHTSLTQYAHMNAPETFLAFMAGKTTTLEIGHGVVCLPHAMNHPIKVAERIATLDILSQGRVNFGVGKGGTEQEAGAFGNTLAVLQDQVDESMYMIPHMWHDDAIAYVQRLIDAGADEIMFLLQMGTVPHAVIMESIENLGKYVIPHFRKKYGRTKTKRVF